MLELRAGAVCGGLGGVCVKKKSWWWEEVWNVSKANMCVWTVFFLLVFPTKKIIKQTHSGKHMPAGLLLLFFKILFQLSVVTFCFISHQPDILLLKHKKRSSVFSAEFQIQWLFTALFWFMSTWSKEVCACVCASVCVERGNKRFGGRDGKIKVHEYHPFLL